MSDITSFSGSPEKDVAHSIDDKDVVERYLTEYPVETEQCLPIALRTILTSNYLPTVPFFSASELVSYLLLLWSDKEINMKLIDAARSGMIYLVAYYLDRGADIHAYNGRALLSAAMRGDTGITELLLDRGADIHTDNDYALRWAALNGHTKTVELLLDRKADIHAGGPPGFGFGPSTDFALKFASEHGRTETVRLLLDRKADIHSSDDWSLRNAFGNGHTDTVELLLERKANPAALL